MDVFTCPLCGAVAPLVWVSPGRTVRCPQCGGLFQARVRADGEDVIDVHAEVIGEDRKPLEDVSLEDSPSRDVVYSWTKDTRDQDDIPSGGRRWHIRYTEHYYRNDSGCCLGIGCALVFLICFLLLRGCLSILF